MRRGRVDRPSTWPFFTCWPALTFTDTIWPLDAKSSDSCVAACSVPVAETVERTTPRSTVAVRTAPLDVELSVPTVRYAATPAPTNAAPSTRLSDADAREAAGQPATGQPRREPTGDYVHPLVLLALETDLAPRAAIRNAVSKGDSPS